jgi:uncharacterized membrane protein
LLFLNNRETHDNTVAMREEAASSAGAFVLAKRVWGIVRKPLAYAGSAFSGYLIYVRTTQQL